MPAVLLLTTVELPHADVEIDDLAAHLHGLGIQTAIRPWGEVSADEARRYDLAVVRSTWDYFDRLDEFAAFVDALPIPLLNPPAVLRWNWHKGYLVELAERGLPVIPTVLVPADAPEEFLSDPANWSPAAGEVIIKPAISAGAVGVGRFTVGDPAAIDHLRSVEGDALVQPFLPEVGDGEVSVLFFGGEYSHAVRKVPAEGDFRVQIQHGGRNIPHEATQAERDLAAEALAMAQPDLLYGRVDMVHTADGPRVMELELIEPELFLPLSPGSTRRFAEAIQARL